MEPKATLPAAATARAATLLGVLFLLLVSGSAFAQGGQVRGRVVDAASGEALPGASVMLAETNFGAATDRDGYFALARVPVGTYTLVATYLGYDRYSAEVQVSRGAAPRIEVRLQPSAIQGEEVVVGGLRQGQARALSQQRTAATITNVVDREQMELFPDLNTADVLQRVPGVNISRSFGVSRGWAVLLAAALGVGLAVVLAEGYDGKAYAVFSVSLAAALAVTLWGAFRRRSGAGWALAGVVVSLAALAATGFRFMDGAFFPAFGLLTAGMLASLGLQTRDERRRHAASRAEAARLEAELLRKHLQPHFLMNTLTTIVEWVETDPATGARALEALAGELRALSDVSGERLIPIARELALCRAHLDVMGYRRDVRFELDAEGVDLDGAVPPAVLHTLIENAVTHNAYAPGTVRLTLRETRQDGRRGLTLRAPLAEVPRSDAPGRAGGGLRYVRARLEEAAPGQWELSSEVEDYAWVTRIVFPVLPLPHLNS